jgi:hypothetical protein
MHQSRFSNYTKSLLVMGVVHNHKHDIKSCDSSKHDLAIKNESLIDWWSSTVKYKTCVARAEQLEGGANTFLSLEWPHRTSMGYIDAIKSQNYF